MGADDLARDLTKRAAVGVLTVVMTGSAAGIGWIITTTEQHTGQLSRISQKLDDLIDTDRTRAIAEDSKAASVDAAIARLSTNDQQHAVAIAQAETALEELKQHERERFAAPAPPNPVADVLSHIFPRHYHRTRRGRGG